jgi:hypothetical protein
VPYLLPSTSLGKRLFRAASSGSCEKSGGAAPPLRQNPRTAVLVGC